MSAGYVDFKHRLRNVGVSQQTIAERAGCHQSTVNRFLSGKAAVRAATAARIETEIVNELRLRESGFSSEEVEAAFSEMRARFTEVAFENRLLQVENVKLKRFVNRALNV